jgi:hypothetical protein
VLFRSIVVSNHGTANIDGAVLIDPLAAGLSVSSVTCTHRSGDAACPSPAAMTESALRGTPGIVIPKPGPDSSLTFTLNTSVDAGMTGDLVNTASIRPHPGEPNNGLSCTAAGSQYDAGADTCTATSTTVLASPTAPVWPTPTPSPSQNNPCSHSVPALKPAALALLALVLALSAACGRKRRS